MKEDKRDLASFLFAAEGKFDRLKQQWQQRFNSELPRVIIPYDWYGSDEVLQLKGRVLVNHRSTSYSDNEDIWDTLWDMYHRFESDEQPFPRVRAQFGTAIVDTIGDEEGFFHVELPVEEPKRDERTWLSVDLTLLEMPAGADKVQAIGKVMIPSVKARFGVISDIDDTVIYSHATDFLRMARTVLLEDARGRKPFPGAAALYRALSAASNPLFYVSSSPWNMVDLFSDLFALQNIPRGPFLLRDWGIKPREYLPRDHRTYKLNAIRGILDFYPHMPFILIGDSGQEDPEIYHELIERYPGRIQAVYIRLVNEDASRQETVRALADSVKEMGTPIILAKDTMAMAEHAAIKGWIGNDDIHLVAAAIADDQ
jgi:phosphatidate phosphatase APP1